MPRATSKVHLSAELGSDRASMLDILDHTLNKGVIIHGNLVISLAGVDLIYLGLDAILTSVETVLWHMTSTSTASQRTSIQPLPPATKQ